MKDNPYKILSVDKNAPQEVIKAAYRALMKSGEAHPDLGGELTNAQAINEAFAILSDEKQRHNIDQQLQSEQPKQKPRPFRMLRRRDRILAICIHCHAINEFEILNDIYQSKCGSCKNWFIPPVKPKPKPRPKRPQAKPKAEARHSPHVATGAHPFSEQQAHSAAQSRSTKSTPSAEKFALYLYQRKLYVRALADFRQLMRQNTENPFYQQMVGMCLYHLHDFLNSSKHLQKSATLKPDNFDVQLHLGMVFARLGRHRGAIPYLQSALRLKNNDDLGIKAWLGDCYYHAGQYKRAIQVLEPVAEQQPELQQAVYVYALSCYKLGDFSQARDRFLDSKQHFPENQRRIMDMVLQCDRHLRMRG